MQQLLVSIIQISVKTRRPLPVMTVLAGKEGKSIVGRGNERLHRGKKRCSYPILGSAS